ncbi:sulfate adenylyltransferase subunit CysN [Rhizobium sp. 007]|uniref:sulfate adenylyltransferase subunit CysN n=1 Tax=Rhizobium sp. 007 TaxID=2785056 RepID=UPI00188F1A4E|nr:sulfate adenylyltransferase subunit CysN [Rhizobium sp. 007]QPB24636.1 sulfate adenylyltransferase subunit CysN [Rhizobium sp. 007]
MLRSGSSNTSSKKLFLRFVAQQQAKSTLRFITCGSVDDGKSTLIGRLLWETQQIFDDQLEALKAASKRYGTQGEEIDFALLVDGLTAEREQGITIDVAYRYFSTLRRKFIIADTPGHEQYTRNMVTAASTADAAVLLIDACKGISAQTRRHAYLADLLGVRHVTLAINKMDRIGFDRRVYDHLSNEMTDFASKLRFDEITAIPISALKGDNISTHSMNMPWYTGGTLLGFLETVKPSREANDRLVMPVQWINRANSSFRGISGTVAEGTVNVGDTIRVAASGQTANVTGIVTMDGCLETASDNRAITITLDKDLDVSRGDVLSNPSSPVELTDHFEATIVWMHEEQGLVGRAYDIKLATQWASASISTIKHHIDVNTFHHEAAGSLSLNDIAVCDVSLNRPLAFDCYENSKILGGFILVDRFTNVTLAAGMIKSNLRRAQNVHRQSLSISRVERELLNGHSGRVIWFTGLSGSGKSAIANALEIELHARGKRTYLLDGDNIRHGLSKDLGFTDADRAENIRRIAEVAKLMMDAGLIVLVAFISPFRRERQLARELIGKNNFSEVYVDTPLDTCERRDPKGLYKKARSGLLPNMTGIGSPYEKPLAPDIAVHGADTPIEESVRVIASLLDMR